MEEALDQVWKVIDHSMQADCEKQHNQHTALQHPLFHNMLIQSGVLPEPKWTTRYPRLKTAEGKLSTEAKQNPPTFHVEPMLFQGQRKQSSSFYEKQVPHINRGTTDGENPV